MTNTQQWFLVKLNWYDWMKDLTDEEVGKFFKALYSSSEPEGMLGVLFKSHYEEFIRVNEKRQEGLLKKAEAGKKGMTSRWNNKVITNDNIVTKTYNKDKEKDNKVITEDNLQRQGQRQIQKQIQIQKTDKVFNEEEFNKLFNL